jgi:hypothetical protein
LTIYCGGKNFYPFEYGHEWFDSHTAYVFLRRDGPPHNRIPQAQFCEAGDVMETLTNDHLNDPVFRDGGRVAAIVLCEPLLVASAQSLNGIRPFGTIYQALSQNAIDFGQHLDNMAIMSPMLFHEMFHVAIPESK